MAYSMGMSQNVGDYGGGMIAGFASGLISGLTGSGGKGLGKDENLELLGQGVLRGRAGIEAMNQLQDYYKTGQWGDLFSAGETYSGALGSYDMTDLEALGQSQLSNLVGQGAPELATLGANEISDILTTDKYDPTATSDTLYKPYQESVMREYRGMSDELDAALAAQGSMYSSERASQQRELAADTTNRLAQIQAQQYENYLNRKVQAASTASNMAAQQQQMNLQRIEASQTMGALERTLEDQQAKGQYNEWMRARGEYQSLIDAAMTLYSGGAVGSSFSNAGAGSIYGGGGAGSRVGRSYADGLSKYGYGNMYQKDIQVKGSIGGGQ